MKHKKEGDIVDAIPAPSRVSKYKINWDHQANMARNTGQPVLAGRHIRDTQVKSLRQYTRPPFRDETGHIAVALRNSSIESDGLRYGDVYFSWIPTASTDTTTKESK